MLFFYNMKVQVAIMMIMLASFAKSEEKVEILSKGMQYKVLGHSIKNPNPTTKIIIIEVERTIELSNGQEEKKVYKYFTKYTYDKVGNDKKIIKTEKYVVIGDNAPLKVPDFCFTPKFKHSEPKTTCEGKYKANVKKIEKLIKVSTNDTLAKVPEFVNPTLLTLKKKKEFQTVFACPIDMLDAEATKLEVILKKIPEYANMSPQEFMLKKAWENKPAKLIHQRMINCTLALLSFQGVKETQKCLEKKVVTKVSYDLVCSFRGFDSETGIDAIKKAMEKAGVSYDAIDAADKAKMEADAKKFEKEMNHSTNPDKIKHEGNFATNKKVVKSLV